MNPVDKIGSLVASGVVWNGALYEPKHAMIAASSSGDNAVIAAAPAGFMHIVLAYMLVTAAAVTVKWKSGSTDITGGMTFDAKSGTNAPLNQLGWFKTAAAEALNVNLSGAIGVNGHLTYITVPV
jgi:hypothetical protein